jgi:hypothetical protein
VEISKEAGRVNLGECDFDASVSYSYGGYAPKLTLTLDSNLVDVSVYLDPDEARRLGVALMDAANAAEASHRDFKKSNET